MYVALRVFMEMVGKLFLFSFEFFFCSGLSLTYNTIQQEIEFNLIVCK